MIAMTDRIFVDSNVWIYLFADKDNPKCGMAESYILAHNISHILVVSYQVINEVTHVLKKRHFTEPHLRTVIEYMSRICIIQDYSTDIALLASDLREKHLFSFWDSHIVASALTAKCHYLATEDMQHNQVVSELTIKNIFQ
jgi:predicted nucleic acid-binding protein